MTTEIEQREMHLRDALRGRRLVYEIGFEAALRETDCATINAIILENKRRSQQVIRESWPATAVVAIAHDAVFAYDRGDLWPTLAVIDLVPPILGATFYGCLEVLELETFPVFEEQRAQRYVSRILAHGGIPIRCLDKFFDLVDLGVERGYEDPEEFFELLSKSKYRLQIDQPIQRFLRDTGEVGRDFLGRVIALTTEDPESDAVELAAATQVPPHVVRAYQVHRRSSEATLKRTNSPRLRRVAITRRPTVVFDPQTGRAPTLQLPPIPDGIDGAIWTVSAEGAATDEGVRFAVRADASGSLVDLPPAHVWRASLATSDGSTGYSASIGALRDRNAMFFDSESFALVTDPRYAPRFTTVLAPCEITPQPAHAFAIAHVHSMLDPRWLAWKAYDIEILLPGVLHGELRGEVFDISVGPYERPRLELQTPIPRLTGAAERNVYSGGPAVILVPWRENTDRWAVDVRVNDEAPIRLPAGTAEELGAQIAQCLPPAQISTVDLSVRGPVGSAQKLSFTVVPGLVCNVPEEVLLPGDVIEMSLSAAEGIAIVNSETREEVSRVRLSCTSVPELLAVDSKDGEARLTLRPRPLEWRIVGSQTGTSFAAKPLAIDVQTGAVDGAPDLQIRCPAFADRWNVRLEFAGGVGQEVSTALPNRATGIVVVPLGQFLGTIAATPAADFKLVIATGERIVQLGAFRNAVEFVLTDARVSTDALLQLHLGEKKPVNRRALRLQCVDRPWRSAIILLLADDQRGDIVLPIPTLLPGTYRIDAAIDDGWVAPDWEATRESALITIPEAGDDAFAVSDSRELLVRALRTGADCVIPAEDVVTAAPACLLLLGAEVTGHDRVSVLVRAFAGANVDWAQATATCTRDFGMSRGAVLRAHIRLVSGGAQFPVHEDVADELVVAPVLHLASLSQVGDRWPRAKVDDLCARLGMATWLQPSSVLGADTRQDIAASRDAGMAARRQAWIVSELRALRALPSPPLHTNTRARGMYVLLTMKNGQHLVKRLTDEHGASLWPKGRWDHPSQRFTQALQEVVQANREPSPLARFHALTMLAACHFANRTPQQEEAARLLADLAPGASEYVETRLCYAFWSHLT